MRLVCLGDLLLDVIVRLEEPLARGLRADASAVTGVGPGGQAANVAAWAAALGAESRFVGKRADDDAGRLAAAGLRARGVDLVGPVAHGRNGVVVSLVSPDGDRTMASDRGVAPDLRPDSSTAPGSTGATTSISPATRSCARRSTRRRCWRRRSCHV